MDLILGIDPGVRGGAAVISADQDFVQVMAFHKLNASQVVEWLQGHKEEIRHTYIEGVGARPTDGVVPAFKFGQNYGFWKGLLWSAGIPFIMVYPLKWQTFLKCRTRGDKNITKQKAQEIFPTVKVTHAIADSLLIAEYGRRQVYDLNDL